MQRSSQLSANKAAEDPPARPQRPAKPIPFERGELVFFADRVELCGVVILGNTGNGYSRTLMDVLRPKQPNGRYVRMGGMRIAAAINATLPVKTVGMGTITGCVKTIRTNIKERMLQERNIIVSDNDVLANERTQGYHYNDEKVTVRDGEANPGSMPNTAATCKPVAATDDNAEAASASANRRSWILAQTAHGGTLTRKQVESKFGIGEKTAKRDLAELVSAGEIEFVRGPAPGFYRRAKRAK